MIPRSFTLGQMATAACLLEVAVPKPGNVHRGADFEDMTFYDMCLSAVAIGPVMESAKSAGVGATVRAAVEATQKAVGVNTNLGTILLLAPLACSDAGEHVAEVLACLSENDARDIYEAIRCAAPGGLGTVGEYDVAQDLPTDLVEAMKCAADRDLIARQYANDFADLRHVVAPCLIAALDSGYSLPTAIITTQMKTMRDFPDSLIQRKCGLAVAKESARRAGQVLKAGKPGEPLFERALASFDFWLRSDGHARNPGTTADMIAAALFVAMRDGKLDHQQVQFAVRH